MPGISLVASLEPIKTSLHSAAVTELKYDGRFFIHEYTSSERITINLLGYKGYPFQSYEDSEVLALLEGFIYNKSDFEIDSALRRIVSAYQSIGNYRKLINDFVESGDGDFLGVIYFKNKDQLLIFNDRWGRLPTYYCSTENHFTLSREMKFILPCLDEISFDHLALAEFLSFEYCLGEKTFFKGIKRVNPSSLFTVMVGKDKVESNCSELYPVDLSLNRPGLSRDEVVQKCTTLFEESLARRVNRCEEKGLTIVADLSGGFDTRAVFAGLCNKGVQFIAATDHLFSGDETIVAEQLAIRFGRSIKVFRADHDFSGFPEMSRITYLTDGTVNCQTSSACYWDDLERAKSLPGLTMRFMGFGGEFIRHPYRLKSGYHNLEEMVDNNAFTNFIPLDDSAALVGLERNELSDDINTEIARFPEKNEQDKLKHLYFEYYNRLVNAGENRHRIFSWTIQPLWGKDLFEFEMRSIPPEYINYRFYIDFLAAIDKRTLESPLYGSGVHLDSSFDLNRFLMLQGLKDTLRANRIIYNMQKNARRYVRAMRSRSEQSLRIIAEIEQSLIRSDVIGNIINPAALHKYFGKKPAEPQLYQLLTVIHYIEEINRHFPGKTRY